MIQKLKEEYRKSHFQPGILGLLFNPFYLARRGLWLELEKLMPHLSGQLLDIGCGSKPYKALAQVQSYVGLEIDDGVTRNNSYADVLYDGKALPFPDASFDCVLSNQVLEHVFEPEDFLKEINRVLKKDGLLLLTVPFVWSEHEQPYDYGRYSSFGLKFLMEKNSFEMICQTKVTVGVVAYIQLILANLLSMLPTSKWLMPFFVFLFAPLNFLGFLISRQTKADKAFYLDNVILAKKQLVPTNF